MSPRVFCCFCACLPSWFQLGIVLFNNNNLDRMDETVGDEVMDAPGSTHIPSKERDFILKPGSSSHIESHEMVIPCEGDRDNSSSHLFTNILDGKNLDRIGSSEHASVSPRCLDNAGVMVEELTLRNYNAENLAVVGTSNNRDKIQSRHNQWQNLYQMATGSGSVNLHGEVLSRDKNKDTTSVWDNVGHIFFSGSVDKNRKNSGENCNEVTDNLGYNDGKAALNNISSAGITRTKMLSKSGFSDYFIKNTLKGKGILYRGPVHRGSGEASGDRTHPKSDKNGLVASGAPLNPAVDVVKPPGITETGPSISTNSCSDGFILRDWLEDGKNKLNKAESLYIFRQIVELVDFSHAQGIALKDLQPSYFRLLQSNKVVYVGSSVPTSLPDNVVDQDVPQSVHDQNEKRPLEKDLLPSVNHFSKKQKFSENMANYRRCPQFSSNYGFKPSYYNVNKADGGIGPDSRNESTRKHDQEIEFKLHSRSILPHASNVSSQLSPPLGCALEVRWYTSPELVGDRCSTFSSNIYSLGVLLFELLGSFGSRRSREAAMLDLRHRILPPDFLSANPKEAGFCLWLLHPEPSSRPTARKILQSEVISNVPELIGDASLSPIHEEDVESELLSHFLSSLKDQKQKGASKIAEEIRCIETDIKEIERRQMKILPVLPSFSQESFGAKGNRFFGKGNKGVDVYAKLPLVYDEKFTRNMRQLESVYFNMRSNIQFPKKDTSTRSDQDLLRTLENRLPKEKGKCKTSDSVGGFFNDLCKYARYSRFKVQGILRNGDLTNSANVICSLSFDRDEDYLASAGVSKKIKIYEFQSLFDDSVDIHYPAVEMSNKSKLSCVCWNSYIRNYLASTDYDGIVKLWDASTGQGFLEFTEHNERAWCVDFSRGDPTKFASGSDDRLVKLWSINEKNSLCTLRNNANVCCVQFSAESAYFLAFSSADYKTYCYDLRNPLVPWCILAGHEKAVSYAKFLDAETLVSASTDNTLKVWDLKKTNPNGFSRDACVLTLQGHTNEKNFVGLSVADGYIACGSETNEVFAYYRSLPMPITAQKFGSIDPISGKETEHDNGQFVSSVCWRKKSDMVVAANSSGCMKLLQMI